MNQKERSQIEIKMKLIEINQSNKGHNKKDYLLRFSDVEFEVLSRVFLTQKLDKLDKKGNSLENARHGICRELTNIKKTI
jgi:hypothetical protein